MGTPLTKNPKVHNWFVIWSEEGDTLATKSFCCAATSEEQAIKVLILNKGDCIVHAITKHAKKKKLASLYNAY